MLRIITLSLLLVFSGALTQPVFAQDFSPAKPMPAIALGDEQLLDRIAFGSCLDARLDQSILDTITTTKPDVFMFIGDNIYAEDETLDPGLKSLRQAYGELAESLAFARLRQTSPLLVTWDDHDYGLNDAGADFVHKEQSEVLFEHAWAVAEDDPRRARPGIYYSRIVGPPGQRVQLILLDTRFFRSPWYKSKERLEHGRYTQHPRGNEMLGQAQWAWLEEELKKPAEIRIIASSLQVIAAGHNWEAWHLMPDERKRFYKLMRRVKPEGVILISGDRHAAGIYQQTSDVPYPLWEVTSSSLNRPLKDLLENIKIESGPFRMGNPYYDANFGIIELDWEGKQVILQIRDKHDRVVRAATIDFEALKAS